MNSFKSTSGDLLVSKHEEQEDMVKDNLYNGVFFISDEFSLQFNSTIGRGYVIDQKNFVNKKKGVFYYPYFNETVVSINISEPDKDELEVYKEDIKLEYQVHGDEIYIRSGLEVTAYSGFYFTKDNNIYRCYDSLLYKREKDSTEDELLNVESVSNPVLVENIETEYMAPVNYSVIEDFVDSNSIDGGILKLTSNETPEEWLSGKL